MRVLAVDPGGTTGMAVYLDGAVDARQKEGYEDAALAIATVVGWGLDAVVCEGFVIRSNTAKLDAGAFNQTTDLIGACRLLALQAGIPFVRQTPAQAKSFATDDKLRTLGWYRATKGGHSNDASRHLLTYLAGVRYAPVLQTLTKETDNAT